MSWLKKEVKEELTALELAINKYKVAQAKINEKDNLINELNKTNTKLQETINEYKNVFEKLNALFLALTIKPSND